MMRQPNSLPPDFSVVLIDDSEEDRFSLRRLLRRSSSELVFDIREADTGARGLTLCRERVPDCLLLDYGLNDTDGLSLLAELNAGRDSYANPVCPVVIVTGTGTKAQVAVRALQEGAQDYLIKETLTSEGVVLAMENAVEKVWLRRELREAEERFRSSLDNMLDSFSLYTAVRDPESGVILDFRCEYVNEAGSRSNHLMPAEQVGRLLMAELFLSRRASGLFEECIQVVETGQPLEKNEFTYDDTTGGGNEAKLEGTFHVRIWKMGDGFAGIRSDITAQKQGELAQAQLAAIVESSEDAIVSNTLDGLIVTWNKGAEAMYGYTAQEVIGQSVSCLSAVRTSEQMNLNLERIRRGERIAQIETVRRHKDGKLINVSLAISPIIDAAGHVTGASAIMRDISEHKRMEAQLAAAAARNERIAETLQRSMLQASPAGKFPGIAVERFYAAAMDEAAVGGDFFDSFTLGAGKVVLVVGDVTGKGLAAAARSTEVKYALRAFLHDYQSPELALFHLNSFICGTHRLDQSNAEVFIVLALAVIDTGTREATFSAAGAEPTLILRADGRAEPVEITGMPLGIQLDSAYTAKTRLLASGDTIVMATDGITEARHGHAFLGVEGMAKLAEKAGPAATLLELSETIYGGARAFASGDLHDDVCLLLARMR